MPPSNLRRIVASNFLRVRTEMKKRAVFSTADMPAVQSAMEAARGQALPMRTFR